MKIQFSLIYTVEIMGMEYKFQRMYVYGQHPTSHSIKYCGAEAQ